MPAQQRAPQADQNVGVPSADTQHLRQVCQSSKRYPVLNPQIIRDRVGWLPRRHEKRTTVAFSRGHLQSSTEVQVKQFTAPLPVPSARVQPYENLYCKICITSSTAVA